MIRYELTDIAVPTGTPCSCGAVCPLIQDVPGRADDAFHYPGDISIHPLVFRTPLGQHPGIEEYQVHQTTQGAAISIVSVNDIDADALMADLITALKEKGLKNPEITVEFVDTVIRHKETGKLKRFIPI